MNPLADKPGLRKKVYSAFWLVGLLLGALQVGYAADDGDDPNWILPSLAVYAFLGTGVGYTASKNTPDDGEGV